ncbi:MAG: hypothetical protein ACI4I4_07140 [Acutalibacteraceae bacterium]
MKKKKPWLSFFVITLALLVAFSFVAISHLLIKSGKEPPSALIDISVSDADGNKDSDNTKTEIAVSGSVKPEPEESKPEVELIGGKGKAYHKEIQVFYAEYGDNGEITVKSEFGDKVVAPGTENSYDLYVRNVGKVPISYILEAESRITVDVNGEQTEIPIEASFYTPHGSYLLGGEESLENLGKLDGVKDGSGLSPEHQAKYTLCWSWPFNGDDEFDTLLGNLAAEGEELTVKVAFNVTAAYDPNAEGGSLMTGDSSNIGLWVALFIVSTFTLIILLFLRKRENDEENSQTHKEKIK